MTNLERKEHQYKQHIISHKRTIGKVWRDLKYLIAYKYDKYPDFDFSPFLLSKIEGRKELECKDKPWHAQPLVQSINDKIALHDNSKFSEPEFKAYRIHVFPCENEIEDKKAWKSAVHHHYIYNPHHYQHWYIGGDFYEIPFEYIIEMMCDWASSYYPGSPKKVPEIPFIDYAYEKTSSKPSSKFLSTSYLNLTTRIEIKKWVPIFDDLINIWLPIFDDLINANTKI